MPRKDWIHVRAELHHINRRGMERRTIFYDDADRDRLVDIFKESSTPC